MKEFRFNIARVPHLVSAPVGGVYRDYWCTGGDFPRFFAITKEQANAYCIGRGCVPVRDPSTPLLDKLPT